MRPLLLSSLTAILLALPAIDSAEAQKFGLRSGIAPDAVDTTTTASTSTAASTVPPLAPAPEDPYAALGIRAGSFILYPSLSATAGYTTNAGATAGGSGSGFGILAPELFVQSDWSRHEATLDLKGAYEHFFDGTTEDDPTGSVDVTGRIDFANEWTGDLAAGASYQRDDIEDPAFPAGADEKPGVVDLSSSAALSGQFGRALFTVEGSAGRTTYEDATSGGVFVGQGDRNNSLFGARLRLGFEATPTLTPFVEGEVSRRSYDQTVDHNGLQRSSSGTAARVGVAFDTGPLIQGEVSVGTATENFDDPSLATLQGVSFDGSLVWAPTALTTVTFDTSTTLNPSVDPASAGSVARDSSVEVAYAWRPNVTLTGKAGVEHETYQGLGITDRTYNAGFGATWKINRSLWLTAGYVHEWLTSTDVATNYQSDTVRLELRAQR